CVTPASGPAKAGASSGKALPSNARTPSTHTCADARSTPSAPVSTSSMASVASMGTPVSPGLGSRFTSTSLGVVTTSATESTYSAGSSRVLMPGSSRGHQLEPHADGVQSRELRDVGGEVGDEALAAGLGAHGRELGAVDED